eukprot:2447275-Alexandrium_andersonii.AAC.1
MAITTARGARARGIARSTIARAAHPAQQDRQRERQKQQHHNHQQRHCQDSLDGHTHTPRWRRQ